MSDFTFLPQPSPALRQQYLASLEEPQEWFIEERVGLGQTWTCGEVSYGVIHDNALVEFFCADLANSKEMLRSLQRWNGFSTALVKSYDHDFVRSCEQLGWAVSVGGFLFRKRRPCSHAAFEKAEIHATTPRDVHAIWKINDDFFASEEEVASLVRSDKLWTVTVDGEIAGCALTHRVIEDSDAVDVGMLVAPNFRRRGLGTYIVREMAERIEREGLRPICGCGASNIASKAALEKAGFVSNHQLLSFTP